MLLQFDKSLVPGMVVQARWTWGGGAYIVAARVVRVNAASVRAEVLEDMSYVGFKESMKGRVLKFPRFLATGYSINNGLFPASKWSVVDPRKVYVDQVVEALSPYEAKVKALPLMFGCPLDQVDADVAGETFSELRVSHVG